MQIGLEVNNYERVQKSDVVICTLWGSDETERQVAKAFNTLQNQEKSIKV